MDCIERLLSLLLIFSYPLRPELIESMMYHDMVYENGEMIHWGMMILEQLKNTQTKVCIFLNRSM